MMKPSTAAYASVNGLKMYYEIYGQGEPLILLHGGVGASEMFGPNLAVLSKNNLVVAVHLQAHGWTADADRPLRFEQMADDVSAMIRQLGFPKANVLGYSFGGGVAWQIALRHPRVVDRLIVVSTGIKRSGLYPEVAQTFEQMDANASLMGAHVANSPLGRMYPNKNWANLFKKIAELNGHDYDWSKEVANLEARIMLVFADADSFRPEHIVETYKAIGGGQRDAGMDGSLRSSARLAIIPNTTHFNILRTNAVSDCVTPFLAEVAM